MQSWFGVSSHITWSEHLSIILSIFMKASSYIGNPIREQMTCHFRASLKHKDDGQTKFIKPNSLRKDITIKYWVSIGSIHKEQG